MANLLAVLPEILLVVLALSLLGIDLALPAERKRLLGVFTVVGMLAILIVTLLQPMPTAQTPAFGGMLVVEPVVQVFRVIFLIAGMLAALLSMDFKANDQSGTYYAMLALTIVGMSLLAGSMDLILLYIALELTGITLYIMAASLRNSAFSAEAGMKYLIFGAVTSTIMLYGISMIFGATGSTNLAVVASLFSQLLPLSPVVLPFAVVMMILVFVGVGFKIAAFPFQFWAPDVYEGAPTPVAGFISVASKAAGFVVVLRLVTAFWGQLEGVPVQQLIGVVAALTMTVGNVMALTQKNYKRMLAFSSIAQAGYVLIGVAAGSAMGVAAVAFYLAVYVFTNIAAFGVAVLVGNVAGDWIRDFAGLNRRSATLTLVLVAALLSLGGVPPFGGFIGKLFLFAAAMEQGLTWLAVVGALNVILSLYYYLSVLRVTYVEPAEDESEIAIPVATRWALGVASLGILVTGIAGYPFFQLILQAVQLWGLGK